MDHEQRSAKPGKRLALFFDGTWDIPESNTNVWRLALMLADRGEDGVPQLKFYDEGVGTRWSDHLFGGAFGFGLSANIRAGYRWLMEHYDPGDQIFIFGFSRGAFTARSLAGIIARCGLLTPDAPLSFLQLYERYQRGDAVRPIDRLRYLESRGDTSFEFEERQLLSHSRYSRDLIQMVGVWDTVGSIGIPLDGIPGISSSTLHFHNTHLSRIVRNSFQALALDEFRRSFWAILWTAFFPDPPAAAGSPPKSPESTPERPLESTPERPPGSADTDDRMIEQRWFAGSHTNVGGGYRNDLLPQRPLAWIQEKARGCGLAFRAQVSVAGEEDLRMPVRDSYDDFLGGLWKLGTGGKHYVRWVMSDPVPRQEPVEGSPEIRTGTVRTVNERIDLSVFRRCQLDRIYRPASLLEWTRRRRLDLESIIAAPERYPQYWSPITRPGIEGGTACEDRGVPSPVEAGADG